MIRRASLWPSSTAAGMVNASPSSSTRSPATMSRRATTMLSSGCSNSNGGSLLPASCELIYPSPCHALLVRLCGRFFVQELFFVELWSVDVAVLDLVLASLHP